MRRFTTRSKVITAVAAAALAVVMTGGVAHAASNVGAFGTTFVDGAGTVYDDFGDHFGELGHSLCNGCADSRSDLVLMWQAILFAEGFLGCSGVDGQFGPNTAAATKKWQSRYGLTADGAVGNATWSKADDRLKWDGGAPFTPHVRYTSTVTGGFVMLWRGDDVYPHYDDGAYSMSQASRRDSGAHATLIFDGGDRIQFKQRTLTPHILTGC